LRAYERVFRESTLRAPQVDAELVGRDHRELARRMLMALPPSTLDVVRPEQVGPLAPTGMLVLFARGDMAPGLAPWMFVPGNVHRDMVSYLGWHRMVIEACSKPFHEQDLGDVLELTHLPVNAVLSRQHIKPELIGVYNWNIACLDAQVQLAVLAGRLRAYKLEKGSYPETLDVLGAVPVDPWNGKPIGYQRDGDGFVLISAAPRDRSSRIDWRWAK